MGLLRGELRDEGGNREVRRREGEGEGRVELGRREGGGLSELGREGERGFT